MKNKPLTKEQEEIFELVSAFEDRRLAGENISIDAYLKEVAGKTFVNKLLLREYLISSDMVLEASQKGTVIPKLSKQDIEDIKAKLHNLQKEKQIVRKIEPMQRVRQIRYAASSHKPKKK